MRQIKFIALFLAFIMLFACLPCNAEQDTLPFTDISQDDWFYSDVAFAYENGFVKGKGNNRFAPTDNITYAEAIKLACCMHQQIREKTVTLENGTNVWYSTYLSYAKKNSIPYEFESYTAFATREDFVHIIFAAYHSGKYHPLKNHVADNTIPDVKMSDKFSDEIYFFYRSGIIIGNRNCEFMPKSFISRAEVCAVINRMANPAFRKEVAVVKETKQRRLIINGEDLTDKIYTEALILSSGHEIIQLPLLALSEVLGATVTWQQDTPTVSVDFGKLCFILNLNTLTFGEKREDSYAPMSEILVLSPGSSGVQRSFVNNDLLICHSKLSQYFSMIGFDLKITDSDILIFSI